MALRSPESVTRGTRVALLNGNPRGGTRWGSERRTCMGCTELISLLDGP